MDKSPMPNCDYYIVGDDGKKFCKRIFDEQGNLVLKTKTSFILLQNLQEQAYNRKRALSRRGKR